MVSHSAEHSALDHGHNLSKTLKKVILVFAYAVGFVWPVLLRKTLVMYTNLGETEIRRAGCRIGLGRHQLVQQI